jgi:hypothetical protein
MINQPLYSIESKQLSEGGWSIDATIDTNQPFIQDHLVQRRLCVSGAYWLECIYSIMTTINNDAYQLMDLVWLMPLIIKQDKHRIVFLIQPKANAAFEVTILTVEATDPMPLVRAVLKPCESNHSITSKTISVDQLKLQAKATLAMADIYKEFFRIGFEYGPSYRLIRQLWCTNYWSLSLIDEAADNDAHSLTPGIVDAAFQTCLGIAYFNQSQESAHLPFSIKCIKRYNPNAKIRYIYTMLNPAMKTGVAYHIFFLDQQGQVIALIQDFMGRRSLGL